MKKFISISICILMLFNFCSCGASDTDTTTTEPYADSQFLGKWYNAYVESKTPVFEIKADGTLIYNGNINGTWTENNNQITINVDVNSGNNQFTGYFVIAGDGFSARATEENMHYIDEGKGVLQLEVMVGEDMCINCVKK